MIEEVVHISSNKDRFAIYPMHSHAFLMNGPSADTATFGNVQIKMMREKGYASDKFLLLTLFTVC